MLAELGLFSFATATNLAFCTGFIFLIHSASVGRKLRLIHVGPRARIPRPLLRSTTSTHFVESCLDSYVWHAVFYILMGFFPWMCKLNIYIYIRGLGVLWRCSQRRPRQRRSAVQIFILFLWLQHLKMKLQCCLWLGKCMKIIWCSLQCSRSAPTMQCENLIEN